MASSTSCFPFCALVGQEDMKLGLLLNVVDPRVGGLIVMGHRGTAKTTAVRGIADLMPHLDAVEGCPYNCAPDETGDCPRCVRENGARTVRIPVPVVDLPLGATEDRVAGTIDLEAALVHGRKVFDPGVLARAHRGFLYIDEVNLLEDHLVDLLLDVAACGFNVVERESFSIRHPARFVLVGTGNPEEGELRPQLLDRFGLGVRVKTETLPEQRVEIMRRRLAFEDDPDAFRATWSAATQELRERLDGARARLQGVALKDHVIELISGLNAALEIDGHRGELTLARAARALAALSGDPSVRDEHVRRTAPMALAHRLRKDPLETRDIEHRIEDALVRMLGA